VTDPVISLTGVGKRYVKYDDQPLLLTATLRMASRSKRSELWAIKDADLSVLPGESVGIVGRNGAGKSTLLQMLAGVTAPTLGRVRVTGRVAPLISVGVGFHPELTGRENVYVNATILGLQRAEIDRRFERIVEFAELERFIDTPVKFYSSGMFVRLGFAVAVEVDPDILIVDEVLAVGDFAFQMKCYERMQHIRESGTTIVVVSHNLGALNNFCDRGVVVDGGRLVFDGDIAEAIGRYHSALTLALPDDPDDPSKTHGEPGVVDILDCEVVTAGGGAASYVHAGETVVVRAQVRALQDVDRPYAGVLVGSGQRNLSLYWDNNAERPYPPMRAGDVRDLEISFVARLPTGSYTAKVTMNRHVDDHRRAFLSESQLVAFYVTGRTEAGGLADLEAAFPTGSAD
jgi:ABC-type polysaccharide/polyol phosphate transport system ATPase subunit